jgi:hypothetical protein
LNSQASSCKVASMTITGTVTLWEIEDLLALLD